MKKALRQRTLRVHFGEPEDFLATSFLHAGPPEEDDEPDEETRARNEVKARLAGALGVDDVSMFKHLLVEIPELVETHLDRPLAHLAAQHGALKILQECVSKPADSINAASSDFEATTPLFWAVKEGHADVTDWLLNNGAFHQPLNVYQDSVVYVAVYYNQTHILDVLKTHRCDCNVPNRSCDLPLMHVIRTGNTAALDCLIEMGVDIYGRTVDRGLAKDLDQSCSTIKQRAVDLSYLENIGPLCQAVLSGNTHLAQTVYHYVTTFNALGDDEWLRKLKEDLGCAMVAAVLSENVKMVELLYKAGVENAMMTTAMTQAENGKFVVLKYLIGQRTSPGFLQTSPLTECIANCRMRAAKIAGYPYCKWDALFIPSKRIWSVHNPYRKIVRVLAEAGLNFRRVQLRQPSPFMEAISMGLLCLMYDIIRYGGGIAITRKPDKAVFSNIFSIALVPGHRPSGFVRKSIRAAFALASYPLYYDIASTFENDLHKYLTSAEGEEVTFRTCAVISVAKRLLHRLHNASELQHLCRTTILMHLNHFETPHATGSLGLPNRQVEYLDLSDILEADSQLCHLMRRLPALASPTHSAIDRCLCIPK